MKAICFNNDFINNLTTSRQNEYECFVGTIVDFTIDDNIFNFNIIRNDGTTTQVGLTHLEFFDHFSVINEQSNLVNKFASILTNHICENSKSFQTSYNDHYIITLQILNSEGTKIDKRNPIIMIAIRFDNGNPEIRVSYDEYQEVCYSFEEALFDIDKYMKEMK